MQFAISSSVLFLAMSALAVAAPAPEQAAAAPAEAAATFEEADLSKGIDAGFHGDRYGHNDFNNRAFGFNDGYRGDGFHNNGFRNNEYRGGEYRGGEYRGDGFHNNGFRNNEFRNGGEFNDFNRFGREDRLVFDENRDFNRFDNGFQGDRFHNNGFRGGEFNNFGGEFYPQRSNIHRQNDFDREDFARNDKNVRDREADRKFRDHHNFDARHDEHRDNEAVLENRKDFKDDGFQQNKFQIDELERARKEDDNKSCYELGFGFDKGAKYDKGYGYSRGIDVGRHEKVDVAREHKDAKNDDRRPVFAHDQHFAEKDFEKDELNRKHYNDDQEFRARDRKFDLNRDNRRYRDEEAFNEFDANRHF